MKTKDKHIAGYEGTTPHPLLPSIDLLEENQRLSTRQRESCVCLHGSHSGGKGETPRLGKLAKESEKSQEGLID